MNKSYLLFDNDIRGYKKSSNLIFFDEYSRNLLEQKKLRFFKKKSILDFDDLKKFNLNSKVLKKKASRYRKELSKIFNSIHKKNNNEKYWGLILDRLIYLIINGILVEIKNISKIKKFKKKIIIEKIKFDDFFIDSFDFISKYETNLTQPYIRYCVASNLGFEDFKKKKKVLKINGDLEKKNLRLKFVLKKILGYFIKLYSIIFKPFLIIDGYIPKKKSIELFLKSKGRILPISSEALFSKKISLRKKKNYELRKLIKVKEKDFIDKIFNLLIIKFLPASYLENFHHYFNQVKSLNSLPAVGTAVSLIYNDYFKFLSAEINKRKGKIFIFQHGGLIEHLRYDHDKTINTKYSYKVLNWKSKKNFSGFYFKQFKKINIEDHKRSNGILIYPTRIKIKYNYNSCIYKKNHPYLNYNYSFYEKLNVDLKKKVSVKIFPNYISKKTKYIWKKKFGKNLKISGERKDNIYNHYRVVVIDDFSTPICELLYIGTPFIIINNELGWLKKNLIHKIKRLKKINMYFDKPHHASNFINQNYDQIPNWWKQTTNSSIFKDFKKELIPASKEEDLLNLLKS